MPLLMETELLVIIAYLAGVGLGWIFFRPRRETFLQVWSMLALLQFNLPLLAIALLIGIATGRWMFRRSRNDEKDTNRS